MEFEDCRFDLSTVILAGKWWRRPLADRGLILCLHGWMDNASSFDELASQLSEYSILSLDLSGHGHSSHKHSYPLWEYAFEVAELIKDHLDKPVHLVGHSLGGIVSLFLPHLIPEYCKSLVMIDSIGPLPEEASQWKNRLLQAWHSHEKERLRVMQSPRYTSLDEAAQIRAKSSVAPVDLSRGLKLMERNLKPVGQGFDLRIDRRLMQPSALRLTEAHAEALMSSFDLPVGLVVATQGLAQWPYQKRTPYFKDLKIKLLEGDHHLHMKEEPATEIASFIGEFVH